jgi:hypothetical protein
MNGDEELSGAWIAPTRALYLMRQTGNSVWWAGFSAGSVDEFQP